MSDISTGQDQSPATAKPGPGLMVGLPKQASNLLAKAQPHPTTFGALTYFQKRRLSPTSLPNILVGFISGYHTTYEDTEGYVLLPPDHGDVPGYRRPTAPNRSNHYNEITKIAYSASDPVSFAGLLSDWLRGQSTQLTSGEIHAVLLEPNFQQAWRSHLHEVLADPSLALNPLTSLGHKQRALLSKEGRKHHLARIATDPLTLVPDQIKAVTAIAKMCGDFSEKMILMNHTTIDKRTVVVIGEGNFIPNKLRDMLPGGEDVQEAEVIEPPPDKENKQSWLN